MATLDDFRRLPQYKDFSDEQLVVTLSNKYGVEPGEIAQDFGVNYNPQRSALGAGLSAGVDQLQGLGYGAIGAVSRAAKADSVADWADRGVQRNYAEAQFNGRPDLERVEYLTLSNALPFLGYQAAKQLPMMAGTLAASALLPQAVVPAALSRGLALVPKGLGGGGLKAGMDFAGRRAALNAGNAFGRTVAASYPLGVGAMYGEAVERGVPTQGDALAALAMGVPYGAAEAVLPSMVRNTFGKGAETFTGGLPTRIAKAVGLGGVAEGTTEVLQNEMEMGFAGELSPEEVASRRLNSAVIGGLVGGMYNAPAGLRSRRPTDPVDILNPQPTSDASQPLPSGQQNLDFGITGEEAIGTSGLINPYNAAGYVDAVQRGEAPGVDLTQPDLFGGANEVVPTFSAPTATSAPSQQVVEDPVIAALRSTPDARNLFKKDGGWRQAAERAWGDYNEFSDKELAGALELLAANPNSAWRIAMLEAIQNARQQEAQNVPSAVDAVSDQGASVVAPGSSGDAQPGAVLDAGVRDVAPAPARSGAADIPVGEPVVQPVAGVAPTAAVPPNFQPTPPTAVEQNLSPSIIDTLPTQQKNVFKHLQSAMVAGNLDDIVGADGKMKYAQIGRALGLARGSVQAAVNGTVRNIAKAQGVSVEEFKAALAARAAGQRTVEAATEDRLGMSPAMQDSVVDTRDVFNDDTSFGVIESAGGSQSGVGVSDPLDTAVAVARPDPIAQKRALEAEQRRIAELRQIRSLLEEADLVLAEVNWNSTVTEKKLRAPKFEQLALPDKVEFTVISTQFEDGTIDEDQMVAGVRAMVPSLEKNNAASARAQEWAGVLPGGNRSQPTENGPVASLAGPREAAPTRGAAEGVGRTGGPVREETTSTVAADTAGFAVDLRPSLELTGETEAESSAGDARPIFELQMQDGRQGLLDLVDAEVTYEPYNDPAQIEIDFVLPEPAPVSAEQRRVAELHAKDLGGEVAWQEGDLALIRGYSMVTGQPLYAVARGGLRSNVGVGSYTGNLVTAEEKARLVEIATALEAEAAERHEAEPFNPFGGKSVGFSRSVPKGIAGVVEGWQKLLGLDARIYVTTTGDAKTDRSTFTGPYRAIASAALDANESGSMRRLRNGDYYIAVEQNASRAKVLEVLAHELGHIHEREVFYRADAETKKAIRAEHAKWVASQQGVTAKQLIRSLRGRKVGKTSVAPEMPASNLTRYWTSFGEWYADQVSRWATTSDKPVGVVEQYFQRLGAALRSFYNKLVNGKYLPNETFKQYLERVNEMEQTTGTISADTAGFARRSEAPSARRPSARRPTTPERIRSTLKPLFFSNSRFDNKVVVVQYADELDVFLDGVENAPRSETLYGTQAFVLDGTTYMIADNIDEGTELAVFLHDVGVHLGMERLLGKENFTNLAKQIAEWTSLPEGNFVGDLARAALDRTKTAEGEAKARGERFAETETVHELIAYFVEESVNAGVNPTAVSQVEHGFARWFRVLKEALNAALRKFGIDRPVTLTPQNIVDLAYGAAQMELESQQSTKTPTMRSTRAAETRISDPQLQDQAKEVGMKIARTMKATGRRAWTGLAFTSDIVQAAIRAGMTSARKLELAMRQKETRAHEIQIDVEKVLSQFADLKSHKREVEKFIHDSTMEQKWGFKPDWKDDAQVDAGMKGRFDALPSSAQDVVKAVFRHGDQIFREKQRLLRDTITGEYTALIKAETDATKKRDLERSRDRELREAGRVLTELQGPYAPLRRYGEYVVVAKSQKYRDAEAAGRVTPEMKRDPKHYEVQFAETYEAAQRTKETLSATFGAENVWAGEKEAALDRVGELPFMVVQRLRKMVSSDLDGDLNTKSKRTLDKLLVDLYISTLHEANARHSEQKRERVSGATDEMMRAFATQGRADSHLISALQHNEKIVSALQELRAQAKEPGGDSMLKTRLRNELLQRHMMSLDYRETPVQDKLLSLNSFWMLLTSPAYYVQNATQVLIMTQPVLAAKYGPYASMNALYKGAKDALSVLHQSSWNEAADLSKFSGTKGERDMLDELQVRGTLDFGISAELGYWENTGAVSKVFNTVMRKLGMGTRKMEVVNRMASALAAYRLAYAKANGTEQERHTKALEYADRVVVNTHGDYSTQNAPRYLRMMPKIMTQFRKFQLIQISLFAKHLHDSFKGAKQEEKNVARAAFGYLALNHTLLAGAVGFPASALLGAIWGATGGDDEPRDWEVDVRRAVGDKELADVILHGLPALININMSNKIGAGTMLDPLPFVEYEASRGGYEKAVTAAMGPFIGGLAPQVVDALGRIGKGDVEQGLAQLLPRGFRDAARGILTSQDGVKLRNGQTALEPDELSLYDSTMMSLGLPTLKTTSRTEVQFKTTEYERFFRERTTKLKRAYSEAYEENDRAAMQETRESWQAMQDSRKKLGFKSQPLSELLKAPREKAKAESKLQNGVRVSENARGFVQSLQ